MLDPRISKKLTLSRSGTRTFTQLLNLLLSSHDDLKKMSLTQFTAETIMYDFKGRKNRSIVSYCHIMWAQYLLFVLLLSNCKLEGKIKRKKRERKLNNDGTPTTSSRTLSTHSGRNPFFIYATVQFIRVAQYLTLALVTTRRNVTLLNLPSTLTSFGQRIDRTCNCLSSTDPPDEKPR